MNTQSNKDDETIVTFDLFMEFIEAFIPHISHKFLGVNSAILEKDKNKSIEADGTKSTQVSFENYINNLFEYIEKLKWDFKLLVTNSTRFQLSAFDDLFVPVDESIKEFVCMMGMLLSNYIDIFKITEHPLQDSNTIVLSGCIFNSKLSSTVDGFQRSSQLKSLLLMVSCIGILRLESIDLNHALYIFNKLQKECSEFFAVPNDSDLALQNKSDMLRILQSNVNKQHK